MTFWNNRNKYHTYYRDDVLLLVIDRGILLDEWHHMSATEQNTTQAAYGK